MRLATTAHAVSLAIAVLYAGSAVMAQNTLHVPGDFDTIQAAVDAAVVGDRIHLDTGTYFEQITIGAKTLTLAPQVPGSDVILSRAGLGGSSVVLSGGQGTQVTLDGLIIESATTSAVRVNAGARVTIHNCAIRNCQSIGATGGGGLLIDGGTATVISTVFTACSHVRSISGESYPAGTHIRAMGGAILVRNSGSAEIVDSTFDGCYAQMSASLTASTHTGTKLFQALGGAIAVDQSSLEVVETSFSGCRVRAAFAPGGSCPGSCVRSADAFGGAIAILANSAVTVARCSFANPNDTALASARLSMPRPWSYPGASWTMRAQGGFIAATGTGGVSANVTVAVSDSVFASPRLVTEWHGTSSCHPGGYPETAVAGHLMGGAIDLSASGSEWVLTGNQFSGGTMASVETGASYSIQFYRSGRVARIATGVDMPAVLTQCIVDGTDGAGVADAALALDGAGEKHLSECRVSHSNVSAVAALAGSVFIDRSQCQLGTGPPITTAASATTYVSNSLLCGNVVNVPAGQWIDLGGNWVLGECSSVDCDASGSGDDYEIAVGLASDCNANGIPDSCDIDDGGDADCDIDSVPDACQIAMDGDADTNGDGVLDSCSLANGDFNLDGIVSGADLGLFLLMWGLPSPSSGDLNGDGGVDSDDLAILLGRWGPVKF